MRTAATPLVSRLSGNTILVPPSSSGMVVPSPAQKASTPVRLALAEHAFAKREVAAVMLATVSMAPSAAAVSSQVGPCHVAD